MRAIIGSSGKAEMNRLTQREQFDRSKIDIRDPQQIKCWTHALGVSKELLRKAVEKVGNSAASVRKELGIPAPKE